MKLHAFRDLKIGYRILILFQFMMIPTIIIFTAMIIVTAKMNELQNRILLENVSSISAAYNLEKSILSMRGLKANYILNGDRRWLDEFDINLESFNFWYGESFDSAYTTYEQNILSSLSVDFSKYKSYHDRIVLLNDNGDKRAAVELLLNESTGVYKEILNKSEELINKNRVLISESEEQLKKYMIRSRYLSYGIIGFFLLSGFILVIFITKSITGPISDIVRDSRSFLPGNDEKNEMGLLKERFTSMIDEIKANQAKMIVSERRAAIGEIAAGISHELNNPVGIICGFTELLAGKSDFTEDDMEVVKDIHREALRCKKLLKDLLDFARTPEPCMIEADPAALIIETINLLKNQERYSGISFNFEADGMVGKICIDPFQIKQVMLNLLLNSCDAVNYSGNIRVSGATAENEARIIVKDNGRGIKKENLDKIFTPFYTTRSEGVGLGLAVCREIIEKHNGIITVNSEPGYGAEFIITLQGGKDESQ